MRYVGSIYPVACLASRAVAQKPADFGLSGRIVERSPRSLRGDPIGWILKKRTALPADRAVSVLDDRQYLVQIAAKERYNGQTT